MDSHPLDKETANILDFLHMVQNDIFINVICILLPKMPFPRHVQLCEL